MIRRILAAAFFISCLAACLPEHSDPTPTHIDSLVTQNPDATSTTTPFQPGGTGSTPPVLPAASPAQSSGKVFLPPSAPPSLINAIQSSGMTVTEDPGKAAARLALSKESDREGIFSVIYAPVAPFPTVDDSVTFMDIQNAWSGRPSGPMAGIPILMDKSTFEAMRFLMGEPDQGAVRILPPDQLADTAWTERPAWAIIPFESLGPRWKVLELDGQSPLRTEFDPSSYPLKVNYSCEGSCAFLPPSNRDPSRMTTLIMTGTTALVRATAYRMEKNGLTYPAQDIGDLLRSADILHITNEISFADGCPYPDPGGGNLQFCSDPKYITLLEYIGTDVVELTGNHVNDWGAQWLEKSIEMYKDRGWGVFGGGKDLGEAVKPYTLVSNENQIAFIGCNLPGPESAWAMENLPGAAPCGDYSWYLNEISGLHRQGYIPVATVQYNEYYQSRPSETQARDFKNIAASGASVVIGSQSHFPQGFAFEGDSYIHYGPGNLFFDQMDYPVEGTRRAAIDRLTIYDGKVIGVELITTMLEDWSRPRLMTPEERQQFLLDLFSASGW
jgi:poly-gamma-glutamate synthesis protein (capsule biosynthesis protein)